MYDVVLIDLDNTVLDFDAAESRSFKNIIENAGMDYTDELFQKYQEINTSLWRDLEQNKVSKDTVLTTRFQKLFQLYGIDVDGRIWEMQYRSCLDDSADLIPHAKQTLLTLHQMGKKIFSASNGVYSTQMKRLTSAGIIDLFDGHFISDVIQYEKPSPCFYEFCLKNIGMVSPRSVIMVGDNPVSDIKGASDFGLDTCFFSRDTAISCNIATYSISDITDLLHFV